VNEREFARLVQERPDLAPFFMFQRGGKDGRRACYRRIPRTFRDRRARPPSQLRAQVAFGEAAHDSFGKEGLSNGLPVAADAIKKKMRGKQYRKAPWELAIEKLTLAMKKVVEVTTQET